MQYTEIEQLIEDIGKIGYFDIKRVSSKRCAVLVDTNRTEVLYELAAALTLGGAIYDPTAGGSTLGAIKLHGGFSIIVKPKNRQGANSAGIQNETLLVETLSDILEKSPVNIRFVSPTTSWTIENVTAVESVGSMTAERKKADILLVKATGERIPISIKQNNAEIWESADRYWAEHAKELVDFVVDNSRVIMNINEMDIHAVAPRIAIRATAKEAYDVVFGSDIYPYGGIVTQTYSEKDFSLDGNTLSIEVSDIIREPEDIKPHKRAYFIIRSDRSRNTTGFYRGLRVLAVYASWISKKTLVIK